MNKIIPTYNNLFIKSVRERERWRKREIERWRMREKERAWVCICERERERNNVCLCMCERERENACEGEREIEIFHKLIEFL